MSSRAHSASRQHRVATTCQFFKNGTIIISHSLCAYRWWKIELQAISECFFDIYSFFHNKTGYSWIKYDTVEYISSALSLPQSLLSHFWFRSNNNYGEQICHQQHEIATWQAVKNLHRLNTQDCHAGIINVCCISSATIWHDVLCQLSHPSASSSSSSATSFSDKSFATRSTDEFSGDASNIGFWWLSLTATCSTGKWRKVEQCYHS